MVKPGDVPVYVESGAADLGVTGTDVLRESGADVLEPLELQFGFCRLVVATPADAPYPSLPGGITARVATKYPRLAQAYFASAGRPVDIIQVGGSVEVAPLLNLSHWIVDLVDTGQHAHGQWIGGARNHSPVRSGAGGESGESEAEAGCVSGFDGAIGTGAGLARVSS